MEQALDVRTMIRMQSLLIAQTKVMFSKTSKSMLQLQKQGRTIDLNTLENYNVSDASIIYGCDSDHENVQEIDKKIGVNSSTNQAALDHSAIHTNCDVGGE